jgi:hypothetical protein
MAGHRLPPDLLVEHVTPDNVTAARGEGVKNLTLAARQADMGTVDEQRALVDAQLERAREHGRYRGTWGKHGRHDKALTLVNSMDIFE